MEGIKIIKFFSFLFSFSAYTVTHIYTKIPKKKIRNFPNVIKLDLFD